MAQINLKKVEPKESEVLRAVCEYLQAKRHFFWRNNSTGVQRTTADGKQFWTTNKYSIKGGPDIIVITDGGYAVFLECKRPSGRLSPDQELFKRKCEVLGAEYYRITNIDQLIEIGL